MKLHCIGDSHCSFFLGYNEIPAEYPFVAKSLIQNIYCYRLGASLAFNVNKYNSATNSRQKIEQIIASLNPNEDIILLCFGEIDCRAHILKQAEKLQLDYKKVIENCISNYLEMVTVIRNKGYSVLLWNAVYSANYEEKNTELEFPYYGTVQERNKVTAEFNLQLANKTLEIGIDFLNISALLIDKQSGLTKDKYYFDSVHLNNRLFVLVVKKINAIFNNKLFNYIQFFSYKIRLTELNCRTLISELIKYSKKKLTNCYVRKKRN